MGQGQNAPQKGSTMASYGQCTKEELQAQLLVLNEEYAAAKALGLSLNMSRGKPAPEQLDISTALLDAVSSHTDAATLHKNTAHDVRNYGDLVGTHDAQTLMAALMDLSPDDVIVCGNSSLTLMYDMVARAMTHGVLGHTPWAKLDKSVKFLCPVPGYDRHFAINEHFGIEMINIPMTADGPDMDLVEHHVQTDPFIKGIWCVPKYSNPTGITYSEATVKRFATLKPAAADFRIYWDNAYVVHGFTEHDSALASIKQACAAVGNEDIWYMFASTSKITFPGAGIAAIAASPANLASIEAQLFFQTIGPDKLNQLRHVLFLRDKEGVRAQMRKHAELLAPRFKTVIEILEEDLGALEIGEWTKPLGGYFISFTGIPHTATRVVQLAKEAGVVLTAAGATYPYGKDPQDANLRIAPTFPSLAELEQASRLFTLCVKIASIEELLKKR
jgi:DNA-binding transcriptional MocR family regulator